MEFCASLCISPSKEGGKIQRDALRVLRLLTIAVVPLLGPPEQLLLVRRLWQMSLSDCVWWIKWDQGGFLALPNSDWFSPSLEDMWNIVGTAKHD